MSDPTYLAGQILTGQALRDGVPWTLLFSGSKSIPTGTGTTTAVDTLTGLVTTSNIAHSVTAGVVTFTDGGLFMVSLMGLWSTAAGGDRLVAIRGSTFGSDRLAASAFGASTITSGHGLGTGNSIPISIVAGETVDMIARQDSGGALTVTGYLAFTLLAPH